MAGTGAAAAAVVGAVPGAGALGTAAVGAMESSSTVSTMGAKGEVGTTPDSLGETGCVGFVFGVRFGFCVCFDVEGIGDGATAEVGGEERVRSVGMEEEAPAAEAAVCDRVRRDDEFRRETWVEVLMMHVT